MTKCITKQRVCQFVYVRDRLLTMSWYLVDQSDAQSKWRGIGRYIGVWKEAFGSELEIITPTVQIPDGSTVIYPAVQVFGQPLPPLVAGNHRHIAVIHDIVPLLYPNTFPTGIRGWFQMRNNIKALSQYQHVITDSQASKTQILKKLHLTSEQVSVVYPGVSSHIGPAATSHSPSFNIPREYALYVGDATWNKNLPNTARGLIGARLPTIFVGNVFKNRDPEFVNHASNRHLAEFFAIVDRVPSFQFPGFVDNGVLNYLYAHALCNLLISYDEGFGYSYPEASAHQAPSVLADRPIFHEIASDAALFANPDDPADIAKKIKHLQLDSSYRSSLGQQAQVQCAQYSLVSFKDQVLKVLDPHDS